MTSGPGPSNTFKLTWLSLLPYHTVHTLYYRVNRKRVEGCVRSKAECAPPAPLLMYTSLGKLPSSHSSSLPLTLLPHPGVCLSEHFQSTHLSTVPAMTQVGLFPKSRFGVGTKFTFQTPTSNTWTIRQKVSQNNHQVEELDPDDVDFHVSEAQTTVFVSNDSDPNGPLAYMRVYLCTCKCLFYRLNSKLVRSEASKPLHVSTRKSTPSNSSIKNTPL